jgi:predicted GNAT superfamily acetyltransferase
VSTEAWELARQAAERAGVELRPLTSLQDCDEIIRVMVSTWGDYQVVPREMIRALAHSGNVPWGAVAGGELVGYVLGWAAVDADEGLHVHSHMLATTPDRRQRGVGYALKLAQRAQALEQGITFARWTFDPLIARNAYFNLHKLGAVADGFERGFYGEMTDDQNRGDRSDRFVVRWDLERGPTPRAPVGDGRELIAMTDDEPRLEVRPTESNGRWFLRIPEQYQELRARRPDLAQRWRDVVADAIEACLSCGLVATGFARGAEGACYAMTPRASR